MTTFKSTTAEPLKPAARAATFQQLLVNLAEMSAVAQETERFMVSVVLETCADSNYPMNLVRLLQEQSCVPTGEEQKVTHSTPIVFMGGLKWHWTNANTSEAGSDTDLRIKRKPADWKK